MRFHVTESAKRLSETMEWRNWHYGYSTGQTTITPAHFVLLWVAGPEEGEPSHGTLSDLFRSLIAGINGNYAGSFITTV